MTGSSEDDDDVLTGVGDFASVALSLTDGTCASSVGIRMIVEMPARARRSRSFGSDACGGMIPMRFVTYHGWCDDRISTV